MMVNAENLAKDRLCSDQSPRSLSNSSEPCKCTDTLVNSRLSMMPETERLLLILTEDSTNVVSSPQDSTLSSRISRSSFIKFYHPDNSDLLSSPPTKVSWTTKLPEEHTSVERSSVSPTELG